MSISKSDLKRLRYLDVALSVCGEVGGRKVFNLSGYLNSFWKNKFFFPCSLLVRTVNYHVALWARGLQPLRG